MSDQAEVRVEREGAVALLVVDRPEARNALAPATMVALGQAIETVAASDARALVLCGGGGRFIAGGDLKALAAVRTVEDAGAMSRRMQSVLAALEALPIPVIAAVDRFALGGGAEVAVAADLRVASHDAVLAFKHGDFAVSTAWGGTRRLARLVGHARALKLVWTGAAVRAHEALAIGLVDEVAAPGTSARDAAVELARTLAARPAGMVAATKRMLTEAGDLDRDAHGEFEAEVFGEVWAHDDHWTHVDAFWARRSVQKAASEADTRGRFYVFEGLDGAGTTTQAQLLVRWLESEGRRVIQTAEPSGGPVGTLLRQALSRRLTGADGRPLEPAAIAALFAADRADHLASEIEPALARGIDVVCDRYVHSSLAYQGVENDPAWVAALNAPMRRPDVVLYLQVPVEVAAARRAARSGEEEIYEVDSFQRAVADGYDSVSRWRPDDEIAVIDGSGSVREVQRAVRAALQARVWWGR